MTVSPLVIGIGNRFRGDDAFGCLLVDALKNSVETVEHDGEPASLMDMWRGRESVILVDAVSSGAEPGTVFFYDLIQQRLPQEFSSTSTHAFGIAEAVELARALGSLPPSIVFYGIEGKNFSVGENMSAEVSAALIEVKNRILEDLKIKEKSHA